ncbi:precorrin-6A synthase (deacetylating) [Sediminimonas qiaohouensis]|uniref:precorrin-6A synthase (deacetylating) n=1 Tax=Sediminimonas qiaohouensis TaxID=552061 RepID=UPI0003F8C3B2|nr:precorrin-6A synthase (deacetylating) [Sediminimonas qiaohouensis]
MITNLWLIGIGTGSESHVTLEGRQALREAATILLPLKGEDKDDLAKLRQRIIASSGTNAQVLTFEYPVRDLALPYLARVNAWHDEIARRWQLALDAAGVHGPTALLVWGDPALYDSTIRIAQRLSPAPRLRVIPGITAVQALTAAHAIPLNTVNGPVTITTGRRLRDEGWPEGAETLVVLLDGETSFTHLDLADLYIWWGAYLGSPEQILIEGPAAEVSQQIIESRAAARTQHGWIMDSYLLRRVGMAGE